MEREHKQLKGRGIQSMKNNLDVILGKVMLFGAGFVMCMTICLLAGA